MLKLNCQQIKRLADAEGVLFEWWTRQPRGVLRLDERVLLASMFAICVVTALLGVPRLRFYGHDVFVALDGAWRVMNGQHPILDFAAHIGPAWYLWNGFGLWLAGGTARGLIYAQALAALVAGLWSFLLFRPRMSSGPCAFVVVSMFLLAAAPFPLGMAPWRSSFAMTYNRYGYVITGLVLLECFLARPREEDRACRFLGGCSSGLASAALLFLKLSFGLVALVLLFFSVATGDRGRARLAGAVVGFLLFAVPMLTYLDFDIGAILQEYEHLASVRAGGVNTSDIIWQIHADWLQFALPAALAAVSALVTGAGRATVLFMAAILVSVADTLLQATNAQAQSLPLVAIVSLLLAADLSPRLRQLRPQPSAAMALLLISLLVPTYQVLLNGAGVAQAISDKLLRPAPAVKFASAHLDTLEFYEVKVSPYQSDNGPAFVRTTEEGAELARTHSSGEESVMGLGMSNPFSFIMRRPPPHGGTVFIASTMLGPGRVPPAERVFGDAALLLLPKFPATERGTLAILLEHHKAFLEAHYSPAAESLNWKLLRRCQPASTHDKRLEPYVPQ